MRKKKVRVSEECYICGQEISDIEDLYEDESGEYVCGECVYKFSLVANEVENYED